MQIQVFHNVADDHFRGYRPGHRLVRVFRGERVTKSTQPQEIAEELFDAFNQDPYVLTGDKRKIADEYRARKLRSLSVGDVVVIGEVPLAVASSGYKPVEGALNILTDWPETSVTVIWPEPTPQPQVTHPGFWCGKFFTIAPGTAHLRSECGY